MNDIFMKNLFLLFSPVRYKPIYSSLKCGRTVDIIASIDMDELFFSVGLEIDQINQLILSGHGYVASIILVDDLSATELRIYHLESITQLISCGEIMVSTNPISSRRIV